MCVVLFRSVCESTQDTIRIPLQPLPDKLKFMFLKKFQIQFHTWNFNCCSYMFLCAISIFIFKCSILWLAIAEVLLLMTFVHDSITVTLRLIIRVFTPYISTICVQFVNVVIYSSATVHTEVKLRISLLLTNTSVDINTRNIYKLVYDIVIGSLQGLYLVKRSFILSH